MDEVLQYLNDIGPMTAFILLLTHTFITLWWLYMCNIAQRPFSWKLFIPVIIFVPSYFVIPLLVAALIVALIRNDGNLYTNFKYYLVAIIFGPRHATSVYPNRSVKHSTFFQRRFAGFSKRVTSPETIER